MLNTTSPLDVSLCQSDLELKKHSQNTHPEEQLTWQKLPVLTVKGGVDFSLFSEHAHVASDTDNVPNFYLGFLLNGLLQFLKL